MTAGLPKFPRTILGWKVILPAIQQEALLLLSFR